MNSYRNDLQDLTELKKAEDAKHSYAAEVLNKALERERWDHEQKRKHLEDVISVISSERDGLRLQLSDLQTALDSASAEECCRRGKEFVGHTGRAVDLCTRCAEELARKEQSLKTCVRMYEGVRVVNDSTK